MSFFRTALISILLSLTFSLGTAFAVPTVTDLNIKGDARGGVTREGYIETFRSGFWWYFFYGDATGESGAKYLMITIARDLKNVVILLAIVYLFIMVIKLIFSNGTEEDVKKWRWGIIWASLGIIVMQIAYVLISTLFDKKITGVTAFDFLDKIIYPFVRLLELLASFAFLAMAFYAFYLIITAGWVEDKAKKGKQTIIFAIIGFLLIKIPRTLVESIYGKAECETGFLGIGVCQITSPNLSATVQIMTKVINYFNGFIGLITVILIIYAWFLVLTGAWDDEKLKKAKSIIVYAFIGIFLLVSSYALFNFFVLKG
jgi:Type IV secretion system pilin